MHRVDYDGDPDAYWYEPSGKHGMTGSAEAAMGAGTKSSGAKPAEEKPAKGAAKKK